MPPSEIVAERVPRRSPATRTGPAVPELRLPPAAPLKVATRGLAEPWPERLRRVVNVVVAVVGLVLFAPCMVLIAVAIRLTSPGRVFYTQVRVGLDRRMRQLPVLTEHRRTAFGGQPFRILKFRTMRASPRDLDLQVWACPDDHRITPVGRLLRRFHLDELPQLVNVLLGEMNVVGPRPEQPKIFAWLRGRVAGYEARQVVRPGITGWAQIQQRYDRCIDDVRRKLALDLEYIGRRSALGDLRIMLRTIPMLLRERRGE